MSTTHPTSVVPEQLRRAYRRISVDVEQIRSKYEAGQSIGSIAREIGVSISVVRERLLEVGMVFRDRARPSASPGREILKRMYVVERMSTRAMARQLGVSSTSLRQWLKSAGVERRSIGEAKAGQKPAEHTIRASVESRRKYALPGRGVVGYRINGYGYVMIWDRDTQSYQLEHRQVMEKKLGRKLEDWEDVHHINEDKQDNRPENLELIGTRAEHLRFHSLTRKREDGRFAKES